MKSVNLCRLLGIIFILSGVAKAFNVNSFAYEVRLYADAYFWEGLSFWATPIAVAVCAIEIFFGLLALHKDYSTLCSTVFLGLLSFFTWLTGINYFAPSLLGSIESCGCFGELIHFSPLASFIKSATLLLINSLLCILVFKQRSLNNIHKPIIGGYTLLALTISSIIPTFSLLAYNELSNAIYTSMYITFCLMGTILTYKHMRKGTLFFGLLTIYLFTACSPFTKETEQTIITQAGENKKEHIAVPKYFSKVDFIWAQIFENSTHTIGNFSINDNKIIIQKLNKLIISHNLYTDLVISQKEKKEVFSRISMSNKNDKKLIKMRK